MCIRDSSQGLRQLLAGNFLPRSSHESPVLLASLNRSGLQPSFPAQPICFSAFRPWSASIASPTAWPNTPSADFCNAVRTPYDDLSPVAGTQRRPPEVRPTAFTARPPNLPPRSLMTMDFAIISSLVRPGRPRYSVFVHRAAALLHASLRPHLTMAPLRFANPSPPSGWIEDSHLQAVDHARHTNGRMLLLSLIHI